MNFNFILAEVYLDAIRRELNKTIFGEIKVPEGPSKREWGIRQCERLGHDWGETRRRGGICGWCDGEGLDCDEEARLWADCYNCRGLGYTSTIWERRCNRCEAYENKRPHLSV